MTDDLRAPFYVQLSMKGEIMNLWAELNSVNPNPKLRDHRSPLDSKQALPAAAFLSKVTHVF